MELCGKTTYLICEGRDNDRPLIATEIHHSVEGSSDVQELESIASSSSTSSTSVTYAFTESIQNEDDYANERFEIKDGSILYCKPNGKIIQKHLDYLYKEQKMCDFIIRNKERAFPIHSFALTMHSDKYKSLFTASSSTKAEQETSLTLDFATSEAIEKVLEYMYTFKIHIDDNLLDNIFRISKELDIKSLNKICLNYLNMFDVNNVLKFIPISRHHGLTTQQKKYTQFVATRFCQIYSMPDFVNLSSDDLLDIIGKLEIYHHHHKSIWKNALEAVILWINKDPTVRMHNAKYLLQNIHFDKIKPQEMANVLQTADDILNNHECLTIFSNGFRCHALKTSSISHGYPKIKKLLPDTLCGIVIIGGITNSPNPYEKGTNVLRNSCKKDIETWKELGHLPSRRSGHCAVILNDILYVLGGSITEDNNLLPTPTKSVFSYNKETNNWTNETNMKHCRTGLAACVVEGSIYVTGGDSEKFDPTDTVECYSTKTKTWTSKTSLPVARSYHAACCHNNQLFVVGGRIAKCILDFVDVFDNHNNRWVSYRSFPCKIYQGSLVNILGRMFYIGGTTACDSKKTTTQVSSANIYEYDDDHDNWVIVGRLAVPRHLAAITTIGTKVVFLGGFSTQKCNITTNVTCFDICNRQFFENIANLPYAIMNAAAVSFTNT